MKRTQRLAASLIVVFAATAASSAQALELSEDMYLVATFGKSVKKHTPMQLDNDASVLNSGVPAGALSSTQTSGTNGYKLQIGYQLHENFAVEGGYVNLGKTEYNASYSYKGPGLIPPTYTGTASRTAKISGFNIVGIASNPISEDLSVFAKAGGFYAQVKTDSSSTGAHAGLGNGGLDKTRWRGLLGVGANYRIAEDLGIRAEFERYNKLGDKASVGTIDINLMSVGLIGKF